jgi:hypothetical protein
VTVSVLAIGGPARVRPEALQVIQPFNPAHRLSKDNGAAVACAAGVARLIAVRKPGSTRLARRDVEPSSLDEVADLRW